MKTNILVLVLATFHATIHGFIIKETVSEGDVIKTPDIVRRALPNSPKGYIPSRVDCPASRPSVRSAASLSPDESAWLKKRRAQTIPAMRSFLNRLDIADFDAGSYFDDHSENASALPNIGIAMSGGGWRALMNGAGAIQAFDSRTNPGHLGGLLQSTSYLAGLSGGSWLVGSLFMNNFSTVTALRDYPSGDVWQFENSILEGPDSGGLQILDTTEYWLTMAKEVDGKDDAGFDITITDIWGRALSFQLINAANGGPSYTWSSVADSQGFQDGATPFPILISDERAPGEILISSNTTIYEFNPFEMGTWDPTAFGFVPTKYLGSNFTAGTVPSSEHCVVGFDNAGFIMGTSSSLFNQILLAFSSTSSLPSLFVDLLNRAIAAVQGDNEDIANYSPNPFYLHNPTTNPSADATTLHLVDGGEDNQNIPFHPLIQPARRLDVIFAVDSSADTTTNWPNGSAVVTTAERSAPDVFIANGTRFPSIPDTNTFVNLGLNSRPTFFGCNSTAFPLIVYIPNYPYSAFSNVSTFDLKYSDTQRDELILNGYNVASMANGTRTGYTDWSTCVGCAVLSRSLSRTDTQIPKTCRSCMTKYCWNGTMDTKPPGVYEPGLVL